MLNAVYAAVLEGRVNEAGMTIYDQMDCLLGEAKWQEANTVLQEVELDRLDALTMVAFLTITGAAASKLPYRSILYGLIEQRLLAEFPAERVKRILVGLA